MIACDFVCFIRLGFVRPNDWSDRKFLFVVRRKAPGNPLSEHEETAGSAEG
jgi:hypothetical protein